MAQQPLLRLHTDFEPRQRLSLAHNLPAKSPSSSSPLQQVQHGVDAPQQPQQQQQQQQQPYRLQYVSSSQPSYRILQNDPQRGPEGTAVTVMLQTTYQDKQLKLAFGSLVVDTRQFANQDYVSLTATVPSFSQTRSAHPGKASVSVLVFDKDDAVVARLPLADFTYENPAKNDRKRVLDAATVAAAAIYNSDFYGPQSGEGPSKRPNLELVRPKEEEGYIISPSNYSSYYQTSPVLANPYASTMQMPQRGFFGDMSSMYGYPAQAQYMYTSTATSAASTPAISSLGLGIGDLTGNASANASAHLSSLPSSAYLAHTSGAESASIVAAVADEVSPVVPGTPYSSNPYASLLNKANLKIQGSMEEMAANWSPEEWDNRRRLVQFWRRQEGNDIFCTFAPVAASERQPNAIVVSCIYWHEKGDCYITSVDTIMLLESLIGVRFTVEEKNRIRRNLEGFRPITVSKCKPESAEFFKLIMSFPNPKPRNIEKDVKVFPWNVLTHALKKIISKYTASYSSTASVNVEAIQNAAYPANLPSSAGLSASDPYGSASETTSPVDSNPLPPSPHVVASQSTRTGSISPLPSQQQGARSAYHQQQQPAQQQQQQQSSTYDALSAYSTSPHSHSHHHTHPQYTYGYRNLPSYSTTTTTEHIGYDDDFQSGASHGGSHDSTPHTMPWGSADE